MTDHKTTIAGKWRPAIFTVQHFQFADFTSHRHADLVTVFRHAAIHNGLSGANGNWRKLGRGAGWLASLVIHSRYLSTGTTVARHAVGCSADIISSVLIVSHRSLVALRQCSFCSRRSASNVERRCIIIACRLQLAHYYDCTPYNFDSSSTKIASLLVDNRTLALFRRD